MRDLPEHVRRNRTTPHVRSSVLDGLSEAWDSDRTRHAAFAVSGTPDRCGRELAAGAGNGDL
jgi:hypothetical protein